MKQYLFYFFIFSTGVLLSGSLVWINSYYPNLEFKKDKVKIEDILNYSGEIITNENFSCEGKINKSVGAVIGSIIEINGLNKRNMLSFRCFENICTLVVTNCVPWQDQECGSRILKFNINNLNEIQPNTFICIDVP